jgi:hypothetical protein
MNLKNKKFQEQLAQM